ncbi:endonuclease domain-containing protein [Agrococcus sp. DT81.2]|uniref:endonuclease domain-containing protein n=1 Tax=Agrococcus sp. DT81.2 TaxID=3393414 RepID=UPI003CE4B57D
MRDLTIDMLAAGGATTRAALHDLGHSYAAIRLAVDRGDLRPIGRSWVVAPDANPSIVLALALRGVLGGASALRSFGVWVTHPTPLQIATRPHAGVAGVEDGQRIWGDFTVDAKPWRVSVVDALAQHCARVPREDAIASIDSALHQGLLGEPDLDRLFDLLPARCRSWRRQLDASADSGLESLLRVPCRDRGWRVETQVPAPGGGHSDLLIDGWLYVEADGSEWHDDPKQAAKDRRRNSAIIAAGGRWLRFGYADVVHERARTLALIALVLSQGQPATRLAG